MPTVFCPAEYTWLLRVVDHDWASKISTELVLGPIITVILET